jgi:hypothetical protein
MGITIFAKGRVDQVGAIPQIIADVKQLADENGWEYSIVDEDFDTEPEARLEHSTDGAHIKGNLGLKGIALCVDPGGDRLSLFFDREGVLTDVLSQLMWLEDKEASLAGRMTLVKTQFGRIESHIRIIELLDWLKQRYMSNLEVIDEGGYWEARDRQLLAERRSVLDHYLEQTAEALSTLEVTEEERQDPIALAEKIEQALKEKRPKVM